VVSGYGTPPAILSEYSWRDFNRTIDIVARRRHNEKGDQFVLAGGDPDDWPPYAGSDEEQMSTDLIDQIWDDLAHNPWVRRIGYEEAG
jgi:hypothetical protein